MGEFTKYVLLGVAAILLASHSASVASGDLPLVLNELMAANGSAVKDPQGQFDDWIEIYNASDTPVDVGGLYLSDDPEVPTRWQFPTGNKGLTTVPAGSFLVVWADGDTAASGLHAGFKLNAEGDALYLFASDGATLLDSVEFDEQVSNVSYGRYPDAAGNWHFMSLPTPGMANAPAYQDVVSDLKFTHERGFYEEPFEVAIVCDTPDATIYYTTDGTEPYLLGGRMPTGFPYTKPIRITKTTCLRAIAVKPDWAPARIETHTYIFPGHVGQQSAYPSGFPANWAGQPADYGMNQSILSNPQYGGQLTSALLSIPSMSLVMATRDLFDSQAGIYANSGSSGVAWERPGSVELIYPDGTDGFQVNCGVRIQGGYFRQPSACRKHSFRLLFKGAYGPTKLRYPLFGEDAAEEFDTIVLRAGANDGYTWSGNEANAQFTRDQFVRDLHRDMGQAAPYSIFVHLYVNGLYWGLYNPCERPDGAFSSSYYGDEKEDWDVFRHKSFTLDQGDRAALNQMLSQCQEAGRSYEALMRLQGKDLDGAVRTDDPCLLDLANYVDYMIVNLWGGNWDWPWNNYWLARSRTPESTGFKFYCWDSEDVMLTSRSPLNMNKITSLDSREVGQPHGLLRENPEYRLLFADRIHRVLFNGGVLTPDSLVERYARMADTIEQSIIPEAARWGDQHGRNITPQDWTSMRNRILTTYLPQRSAIVLGQFRTAGLYPNVDAPVFHVNGAYRHGGHITSTDRLSMQAGSIIYYTLDGSDPRVPSMATSTGGGSTTLVAENAAKRVLVPASPVNDAWRGGSPFDDTAWISGTGGIGYERSTGYEHLFTINLLDQMYARQTSCYIRIPFTLDRDPATLEGVQLRVRYDDGFIAWLNGAEVARRNYSGEVAWNSAAEAQNSDIDAVNFEDFSLPDAPSLLKTGPNILAIQGLNQSVTSSDFLISVMLVTSAGTSGAPGGTSATAVKYAGPIMFDRSACVKARALSGTTWSALNEAVFAVGPVAEGLRISEIMYHPAEDPNAEYVELTNVGSQAINLNLVRFTDGIEYIFPSFELPPSGYCLLVRDIPAFEAVYPPQADPPVGGPVLGQYTGSLNNAGERIELLDAAGQVIQSFEYKDNWFDLTDGMGFSLTARDSLSAEADGNPPAADWRPSAHAGGSPGEDDSGQVPELGSVVINELLANPAAGGSDWIELHNTTAQPISVAGWYLSDDANDLTRYSIAAGTSIPAGGYVVLHQDQHFGNGNDPGCAEPFGLSKDGETLYLHSGSAGVLTGYSEQEKFDASETGVPLGRWQKSTGSYNFVALTEPTPGAANASPVVGPIVINEIMYHPADAEAAEYVELFNISSDPVTLYDAAKGAPWRFTDDPDDPSIELLLSSDPAITLAPGGYLVIAKDLSVFNARYTVPAGVPVLAWGLGKLANGGQKVQISKPGEMDAAGARTWTRVDRGVYSNGSNPQDFAEGVDPWPAEADGTGLSLGRIDPQTYGNDPTNWQAAAPSPGRMNP